MAFGVTTEGFTRPNVQEIKEALEREQLASIDPTLDIATDPVVGQINGIFSQHLGKAWEALEAAYNAFDPDRAEDAPFVSLAKLTGTDRRGITFSEVDCICNFANDGVLLEAGVNFANVEDRPDIRFTPKEDFTSPAAGNFTVRFRAENGGPIAVDDGMLNIIATPVTGWNTVVNDGDAIPGSNVETIPELRLRREAEIARRGAATIDAIRADVSAVEGVEQVHVSENRTDTVNNSGLPPHSIEVIIFGDNAVDDEVAQAIWGSKAAGIRDHSGAGNANISGGTAIDELGGTHATVFTRAEEIQIWIDYELSTGSGYVGDTIFKQAIAALANSLHNIDDTVIASRIRSLPFEDDIELADGTVIASLGVTDVVNFDIGTTASPTLEVNIPISQRQIARFDTGRIVVT